MLKQKSKFLLAIMFLGSIAFAGCNDAEKSKTTETNTMSVGEPKMDTVKTMMDSSAMPKMDTATTRPIKPASKN